MKSALHCQLLLPGVARQRGLSFETVPALRPLLRHAHREQVFAGDDAAWLCHCFGVARQQDWPAGPYAALGDGLPADDGYWLRADPVSLVLQRDSFSLAECSPALRLDQAQQLVAALNAHFSADGMQFHAADARRWYLRLARRPDLLTHPFAHALGRDIQPRMPQGADGLKWHGLLNELQMLLHAHPVNADLEQQGALPVNSIWPWGGGELAVGSLQQDLSVWTNDPMAHGLALAHDCRTLALPVSAQEWLPQAEASMRHLVVLPSLAFGDPQPALDGLERDWLAPLLSMLREGKLARVTLHLAGETVNSYTVTRGDLYKFWRRARPLENYFG